MSAPFPAEPEVHSPGSGPPDAPYLTALAGLPLMGPYRLLTLFRALGAAGAWRQACSGTIPDLAELDGRLGKDPASLVRRWAAAASRTDPAAVWAGHVAAGISAAIVDSPGYPAVLADDPEPPAIVFMRGRRDVLDGPRVAVVGTRNCTRIGRELATDLGRGLAAAGVRVVSGLALGVDGAAHLGALAAAQEEPAAGPPVAVVAVVAWMSSIPGGMPSSTSGSSAQGLCCPKRRSAPLQSHGGSQPATGSSRVCPGRSS